MDSGWTSDLLDPAGLFAVLPTRVDAFDRDDGAVDKGTAYEEDNPNLLVLASSLCSCFSLSTVYGGTYGSNVQISGRLLQTEVILTKTTGSDA